MGPRESRRRVSFASLSVFGISATSASAKRWRECRLALVLLCNGSMSLSATLDSDFPAAVSTPECTSCKAALDRTYYQTDAGILCPACAQAISKEIAPNGGRFGRLAK